VDLRSGELRKSGVRLKLSDQPFQALAILLEQPGQVVTREELQKRLWPDTFVDVDHNLNTAINKIREVLGDVAENPRFVETLPRRGYRFIGEVSRGLGSTDEPREETNAHSLKVWIAAFVGTAAVSVLAASIWYLGFLPRRASVPTGEPAPLSSRPFTAFPGVETAPAFSPDGSRIAFAWTGDTAAGRKGFDLYIKAIGSETLLRLTNHPSEFISPTWSPDGTQIAFHRLSGTDTGVYVVSALGGPERKLRSTRVPFMIAVPISWSPDGKWIAYNDIPRGEEHPRIYLLSLETLESSQIPHAPKCIAESLPAFSHSGNDLAYECLHSWQEFGIYSITLSGGSPKLVAIHPNFPVGIAWSTDDQRLLFSEGPSGNDAVLNEITLADGQIRQIPLGQSATMPTVSPKGDRLAYSASSDNINIWRRDLLHPEAPAVKFLASSREQMEPQYSPNGEHIAFTSTRAGSANVWMSDADGSNLVQVSNLNMWAGGAQWSYDGKKIAFVAQSFSHSEIYVADLLDLVPRKLVTNIPTVSNPTWSHDGKWIYFASSESVGQKLYRCPATGGDAMPLTAQPGYGPLESPDGRMIYFAAMRPSKPILKAVALDRPGTESSVEGLPRLLSAYIWTMVEKGIYFVPAEAPRSLRYFDFASRRARSVLEVDKALVDGMSVSPDGHWILYSQVDEENRDIMIVDHFR
jgi:Tol biopolymer transport system component/DNA-binding winged helix-turn-helix (wHTH) protein